VDTARAVAFIQKHGSDLEKARLGQILHGAKPEQRVIQGITELQNDDGGFPRGMVRGNASTVHKTLLALLWMDELGVLKSPETDRALAYLLAVQRDDGGWDEQPSLAQYGLPPWVSPGDLRARLYLTASSAYWLAAGDHENRRSFERALGFLLQHRDDTGRFRGFLHTTWIATSALIMDGPEYSDAARKGLTVLMARPLPE